MTISPWAFLPAAWGRRWKCRRKGGRLSNVRQFAQVIRKKFRQFTCRRCRKEVAICSHCDRGQCYCGKHCSSRARRRSTREAGARYQKTTRGRRKHAARNALYLLRKSASARRSLDEDPSGHPASEVLVHTGEEDATVDHSLDEDPEDRVRSAGEDTEADHPLDDDPAGHPASEDLVHTGEEDIAADFGRRNPYPSRRPRESAQQTLYLREPLASSRRWSKCDASGFPGPERLVQTVGEDAEDDLGDAQYRFEPAHGARTATYCCVCGARCATRRDVRALRQHR